jgi:hopanoid C-3 methylase
MKDKQSAINMPQLRTNGPFRILLVKPHPYLTVAKRLNEFLHLEPLELEIVAGGVPAEDYVSIYDMTLEKKPMEVFHKRLDEIKPDIVGFTGYSNQSARVKELAQIVKKKYPSTIVVVGGIHAIIAPADYAVDDIDLIVRGEGGTTFREIIRRLKAGEVPYFGDVSLSKFDKDFQEKASAKPPAYPQVGEIPLPRRDLVERSRYFTVWTSAPEGKLDTIFPRMASVRTSYGCKFNCAFCVVHYIMGRKYLERDPEDVVNEIGNILEEHIYFVDDETFLNEKRMTRVAELLLERGIKKKYVSWARADTIVRHPEMFRLWKKAGLEIVYVGLEAMDETRLKNYKKLTSVDINRKAVAALQEIGLTLHASLMVDPSFSVDDFKSVEKTIMDIRPAEISFTVFSPSPGTELWHKHKDEFICDPYLFYDCMHTLLPTKLEIRRFYAHFAKLYRLAWSTNPLRVNKVKVPGREVARAIVNGTKYIFALRAIHRDYYKKQ